MHQTFSDIKTQQKQHSVMEVIMSCACSESSLSSPLYSGLGPWSYTTWPPAPSPSSFLVTFPLQFLLFNLPSFSFLWLNVLALGWFSVFPTRQLTSWCRDFCFCCYIPVSGLWQVFKKYFWMKQQTMRATKYYVCADLKLSVF